MTNNKTTKTLKKTLLIYILGGSLCIKNVELSSAHLNVPDEGYERCRLMDALFCLIRPTTGLDFVIYGTGSISDPLINKED